jgi:hypothetical protein
MKASEPHINELNQLQTLTHFHDCCYVWIDVAIYSTMKSVADDIYTKLSIIYMCVYVALEILT